MAKETIENLLHSTGRFTPEQATDLAASLIQGLDMDGFVIMPKKLTAENGAKGLLIGEFHEIMEDENEPGNPFIVPVTWDNIKKIYSKSVQYFSRQN